MAYLKHSKRQSTQPTETLNATRYKRWNLFLLIFLQHYHPNIDLPKLRLHRFNDFSPFENSIYPYFVRHLSLFPPPSCDRLPPPPDPRQRRRRHIISPVFTCPHDVFSATCGVANPASAPSSNWIRLSHRRLRGLAYANMAHSFVRSSVLWLVRPDK